MKKRKNSITLMEWHVEHVFDKQQQLRKGIMHDLMTWGRAAIRREAMPDGSVRVSRVSQRKIDELKDKENVNYMKL